VGFDPSECRERARGVQTIKGLSSDLTAEVQALKDATYARLVGEGQADGRLDEARRLLCRQRSRRFGKPDAATVVAAETRRDIDRLEAARLRIADRDVRTWDDLLQGLVSRAGRSSAAPR
jgi:hypothetical protein